MLYLCATPIGNLEDITLRVLRILKEVDMIAAEDTRHTLKLLNHFEIRKPLMSYHEHNKREKGKEIVEFVRAGKSIALVSDAGMPGISDPGSDLVLLAIQENIPLTLLPGASAALTSIVLSGLNTERFVFEGFLPKDRKERKKRLNEWKQEIRTIIVYEAPHHLRGTLQELLDTIGDRKIALARELTKIHEEVIRSTLKEAVEFYREHDPKGEFVLLLEGAVIAKDDFSQQENPLDIQSQLLIYIQEGMEKKDAVKKVARERGLHKSMVYPYSIDI